MFIVDVSNFEFKTARPDTKKDKHRRNLYTRNWICGAKRQDWCCSTEVVRICNEVFTTYLKMASGSGEARGTCPRKRVLASLQVEIWTQSLQNTKQEFYPLIRDVGWERDCTIECSRPRGFGAVRKRVPRTSIFTRVAFGWLSEGRLPVWERKREREDTRSPASASLCLCMIWFNISHSFVFLKVLEKQWA